MDHRRHRFSQEGRAFGRGSATILRAAWQDGELPSRCVVIARQSSRQPAGRLSAVFAGRMEQRSQTPAQGGRSEDVGFKTKPEIALEQIAAACAAGLPHGVVLMDAAYGNNSDLRSGITTLGLAYAAAILSKTSVWAPGTAPLPAKAWSRPRPATQADAT